MLILTRRMDDRVVIGDDVVVTLVCIDGNKVRLGFSAPSGVAIAREEVFDQMHGQGATQKVVARYEGKGRSND
jgi:carbon storage regulator